MSFPIPVPPKQFNYGKEQVMGVLPYVRSNGIAGVNRWMIVFTSSAVYFVYCGMDTTFIPGIKAKKLEEETKNKSLEELLKYGQDFYRVSSEQLSKLNYKKGFLANKVWFVNSLKHKVLIHLKNAQYIKFVELLSLVNKSFTSANGMSVPEITKEYCNGTQDPVFTVEELKQEKRRKNTLGIVLLVNSLLSLGLAVWLGDKGLIDGVVGANITPAIIDIVIAVTLFKSSVEQKNQTLNLVYGRAILGLVIWGGILASKQDWVGLVIQLPYFGYLIYHSKVKASARSFKIAMVVLVLAVVTLVGGTYFSYAQASVKVKEYDAKLMLKGDLINNSFVKQTGLVFPENIGTETAEEARNAEKEILRISYEQKKQIEDAMPLLEEGLKEFKDTASQKNLSNLKTLYELERVQNQAVIDYYEYVGSLDVNTITPEQESVYKQKEQTMRDAYAAVNDQGNKMQGK